jgi:hypoxanthine-guanine phosphoribosyltransferase
MRDDIERVLIDEAVIEKRLDAMAAEIERDFPQGPLVVIILLKGALVFAADLLRRVPRVLEIPWWCGELGRGGFFGSSFPRGEGASGFVAR